MLPRSEEPDPIEILVRKTRPFVDELGKCVDLLPRNPRDGVRLINAVRVGHEVQASEARRLTKAALSEAEFVTFSVMLYNYPKLFEPDLVEGVVLPKLRSLFDTGVTPLRRFRMLSACPGVGPATARRFLVDLIHLKRAHGGSDGIGHFFDPQKVSRFIEVNRYILEIGGIPEQPTRPRPIAQAAE